ncbi:hypothetical protein COL516b_003157 [Colletotrichum fioriniae]|nr:uncharacterized protein COL516b_003157 [Colletotrichum fioriniae]KAJ0309259.1 hypothetical protein COL516b_003157 [Colletotrichum fioriniae]
MAWPGIDRVIMPNGRIITEDDDDELFGFDFNSHVPRGVSVNQVAYSRYGRLGKAAASGSRGPSAPIRLRPTWVEDLDEDEDEDEDYDDLPPLVDGTPHRESKHLFIGASWPSNAFTIKSADPEAPKQAAPSVLKPTASHPLCERMQFSGTLFPTKFGQRKKKTPLSPEELFPPGRCMKLTPPVLHFINRYDTSEAIIYTDGACFGNGNAAARGGSAFIFKPVYANDQSGRVAFKLEDQGSDGKTYRHTSNRAELRAAVAALRYRAWAGEGFRSIVIATGSTYVVNGATDWARAWVKKGWRLSTSENVKNRDLWEALLLNVERLYDRGVSVRFWWIPRKFIHEADRAAKGAAYILAPKIGFSDLVGVCV